MIFNIPSGTHERSDARKIRKVAFLYALCLCGKQVLLKYLQAVTGLGLTPGIIAVIQSFGSKINPPPHFHFLITEGGVDKDGQFHKVSSFNDDLLAELFAREVFAAGDVTCGGMQVVTAAGEGAVAAMQAVKYLRK